MVGPKSPDKSLNSCCRRRCVRHTTEWQTLMQCKSMAVALVLSESPSTIDQWPQGLAPVLLATRPLVFIRFDSKFQVYTEMDLLTDFKIQMVLARMVRDTKGNWRHSCSSLCLNSGYRGYCMFELRAKAHKIRRKKNQFIAVHLNALPCW